MKMVEKSEWKCGDCGKKYTTDELIKLKKVKAVETDINPKEQHGYICVCKCGYIFHKDRWQLKDNVTFSFNWLQGVKGFVSTIFLELNHFGYWYETMIFIDKESDCKCSYQNRYVTIAEARKGHREVLRKIENNEFELNKKNKEIVIEK